MAWRTIRSKGHEKPFRVRSPVLALIVMTILIALSTSGCRISNDDVHAWAKKASGPRKLLAVVQHDKYSTSLRVSAAMTLVTMPTRGGNSIGLTGSDEFTGLLAGLKAMSEKERALIVEGMLPHLITGMQQAPREQEADSSFAFKDSAFALLHYNKGELVSDKEVKARLKTALSSWCQQDFVAKMDDNSQLYGMEQVLRYVGSQGVEGLTGLLTADFRKLRQLTLLISELGDEPTKLKASGMIAKLAKHVESDAWIRGRTASVKAANKSSGLSVNPKQLDKQLQAYQAEELNRILGAMKILGHQPIIDYLIALAEDGTRIDAQRAAALAALEGHLDKKNPTHAKALLALLSDDQTPDLVRDLAARRIGELSRDQVADHLYALFGHERWQLRWSVASLLLKMSKETDVSKFMDKLGDIEDMALSEPFSYGKLLGDITGVVPEELLSKYGTKKYPAPVRLSALGYYYDKGTKADLAKVEVFKTDEQKVPSCRKDAKQCAWECTLPAKSSKDKAELKAVKTVGNFVEYCLIPAMSSREAPVPGSTKTKSVKDGKKNKN